MGPPAEVAEGQRTGAERIGARVYSQLDDVGYQRHEDNGQNTDAGGHRDVRHASGEPAEHGVVKKECRDVE